MYFHLVTNTVIQKYPSYQKCLDELAKKKEVWQERLRGALREGGGGGRVEGRPEGSSSVLGHAWQYFTSFHSGDYIILHARALH